MVLQICHPSEGLETPFDAHHWLSQAPVPGCRGTLDAGQAAPLSVVYTPATAGTFSCQSFQVLSSGGNKVGTAQAASSCQQFLTRRQDIQPADLRAMRHHTVLHSSLRVVGL